MFSFIIMKGYIRKKTFGFRARLSTVLANEFSNDVQMKGTANLLLRLYEEIHEFNTELVSIWNEDLLNQHATDRRKTFFSAAAKLYGMLSDIIHVVSAINTACLGIEERRQKRISDHANALNNSAVTSSARTAKESKQYMKMQPKPSDVAS